MIDEIKIENIALISSADLRLSEGLTVITGETGSGKTALLSAVQLLIGARGDKDMIREGERQAQIQGRVFLAPASHDEDGVDPAEEELIISRSVSLDGRNRITINGAMAAVRELAARIGPSVDLCGQHEHQQLLRSSHHGALLDAWIGAPLIEAREAYRSAFTALCELRAELEELTKLEQADAAQIEEAAFIVDWIDRVGPAEGEYESLLEESKRLGSREAIEQGIAQIEEALEGDEGAIAKIVEAQEALKGVQDMDSALAAQLPSLQESLYLLEDVARECASRKSDEGEASGGIEQIEDRIAQLQGLMRRFGPSMEEVFASYAAARRILDRDGDRSGELALLQARLDEAEKRCRAAASALFELRRQFAPRFAARVDETLGRLEMAGAHFSCEPELLPEESWTLESCSKVSFLFSPAEGMSFRPLQRIASGGELSRVLLAIKTVLGASDGVDTLIFDEVDAGVGGKTARSLAELLKDLSRSHQVVVVTHLAQIAAMADHHLVVEKEDGCASIFVVEGERRVAELARMLSGSVSEAACRHAEELLQSS